MAYTPASALASQFVDVAGDTMSGELKIAKVDPSFAINDTGGVQSDLRFEKGGVNRWIMRSSGTESGADAGSDLALIPRTDAGAGKAAALYISRQTSLVTLAGDPTAATGAATKQYVDSKAGGGSGRNLGMCVSTWRYGSAIASGGATKNLVCQSITNTYGTNGAAMADISAGMIRQLLAGIYRATVHWYVDDSGSGWYSGYETAWRPGWRAANSLWQLQFAWMLPTTSTPWLEFWCTGGNPEGQGFQLRTHMAGPAGMAAAAIDATMVLEYLGN